MKRPKRKRKYGLQVRLSQDVSRELEERAKKNIRSAAAEAEVRLRMSLNLPIS